MSHQSNAARTVKATALLSTLLLGLGMLPIPSAHATPQTQFTADQLENEYNVQVQGFFGGRPHVIEYDFSYRPIDYYRVTFIDGVGGSPNGATEIAIWACNCPLPTPDEAQ